jgi:hypothetical protein
MKPLRVTRQTSARERKREKKRERGEKPEGNPIIIQVHRRGRRRESRYTEEQNRKLMWHMRTRKRPAGRGNMD